MQPKPSMCSVNGFNIAYHSEGEGEPVLMVHGITTYSFLWRKIAPLLKANYRVIRIDLLGCGDSDKPVDVEYSLPDHAEMVRVFLDNLGIEKVHFVGHDVGGGVAQIFSVNCPERVIDLALVNSVGHDFWPVQPIIAMRTPIIRQLAMASLDIGALRLLVRKGLYYKERVNDELMEYFWKPMQTKEGRRAFLHFADCLNNRHLIEIEEGLQALSLKTLIIRSEADVYLSGAIAEKLHKDIPGSELLKIETGGHYLQEDEPEMVAAALLNFFKGN